MADTQLEQTYRRLRQAIIDGRYLPSERLPEMDLARAMEVSRFTVRAALQRLSQERLVTLEPHRGAKVAALSLEEALEIVEFREGLEGWAAALAAERIRPEQLKELRVILAEMEAMLKQSQPIQSSTTRAQHNLRLHRIIAEASGNRRLQQSIEELGTAFVRYTLRSFMVPGRWDEFLREHRKVVAALEARSPRDAEAAMRKHIRGVRESAILARRLQMV